MEFAKGSAKRAKTSVTCHICRRTDALEAFRVKVAKKLPPFPFIVSLLFEQLLGAGLASKLSYNVVFTNDLIDFSLDEANVVKTDEF